MLVRVYTGGFLGFRPTRFFPSSIFITRLGVLDGHDDTGGEHDLFPGLADVKDVDAILFYIIFSGGGGAGGLRTPWYIFFCLP